jgi:hypothetical protein
MELFAWTKVKKFDDQVQKLDCSDKNQKGAPL